MICIDHMTKKNAGRDEKEKKSNSFFSVSRMKISIFVNYSNQQVILSKQRSYDITDNDDHSTKKRKTIIESVINPFY